ncbi:hypothetical protein OPV22_026971 [Ensete ventricosum]|uniref:protein-serine/threonine phosphatase n=1 Tax=Ensete ventricosum TaxID=4639 RepID=A0AAV8PZ55_ENSVE|nr:hypothetical protein OPV22_026971 [Ensete ventricosum]
MWWRALEAGFARVDAEVMEATRALKKGTVGSTAVVAEKWIVVANCGDSRAVLSRGGVAVPLSIDHKPDRPDELRRVLWGLPTKAIRQLGSRTYGYWSHREG